MLIPHPKQEEILRSKARYKVIRAGRRGGKTSLEVEDMAFDAVSKGDRNIFYIAPTQIQAREIIWELFKKRLNGIASFNEQRLEITVPSVGGGASHIKLAGWENRENFRGKAAYKIVFDETDTMKDFFIGWQEIFRPALMDTEGKAVFIGTPKKENPNLRRLEKMAETDPDYKAFHFTSLDNPHLPEAEKEKAKRELDPNTYRQEVLAEYVENEGALFRYTSLLDMFSNTVDKSNDKYLTVDIADEGSDKTIFSFWNGLECYRIEMFTHILTDGIVSQIRESAALERIPYSHIAVDAIGVGAGVASSPLMAGIIGFKSSFSALRTTLDPTRLPNVHFTKHAPLTSEYANLRSQCVFALAEQVNDHKLSIRNEDPRIKSAIIEELAAYQDVSKGDGKRMATMKEDVKAAIGRSPDISDTLIMRMYFHLRSNLSTSQSFDKADSRGKMQSQFRQNEELYELNSNK